MTAPAPSMSAVPRAVEEKAAKPESASPLAVREREQLERQLAEPAERKNLGGAPRRGRPVGQDRRARRTRGGRDTGNASGPAGIRRRRGSESARRGCPRSGAPHSGLRHDGGDATVFVGGWRPDGPALAGFRGALAACRTRHRGAQQERGRDLGAARHRRANAAQGRRLSVSLDVLGGWRCRRRAPHDRRAAMAPGDAPITRGSRRRRRRRRRGRGRSRGKRTVVPDHRWRNTLDERALSDGACRRRPQARPSSCR